MEDPTLFMLCDPKKCKKIQNNMDVYLNNYEIHSNNLNENEPSESDDESTQAEKILTMDYDISEDSNENLDNEIPEHMVEVIDHINHIDTFILNNKYDIHMEKINDYLIDLLFLIKSKKNKK